MLFCHLERSGKKIYCVIKKRSFKIESSHWGVPQKKQFLLKNITNRKESLKQIIKRLSKFMESLMFVSPKKQKNKNENNNSNNDKKERTFD